jgi:predicted hydrocarbon binding protein
MSHSEPERKYKFDWSLLGDMSVGRPNLGPLARVEIYRLMQFTFRDVAESRFGREAADEMFFEAGHMAGKEFFDHLIKDTSDNGNFMRDFQELMREYGIGVVRMEELNEKTGNFIVSVAEDLNCSGFPEVPYEICKYDEGFISGIVESFTGTPYNVREIDCWQVGDRTCRFAAEPAD